MCPRLGTPPPVSCPGSPEGRLADKQNSNIHSTAENQHPLTGRRGSSRSGTTDRGKCPSSGHVHPVNLSLPDQPGTVRPGAYVPDLGHRPRSPVPVLRTVAPLTSRIPTSTALRKFRHPLNGRRGSLRSGTTDRGKCPSSGHVHPVNLSLHPVSCPWGTLNL